MVGYPGEQDDAILSSRDYPLGPAKRVLFPHNESYVEDKGHISDISVRSIGRN